MAGERKMTPAGLEVNHYTALLVAASVLVLLAIGKGITGFKVPLTNVNVSAK